MEQSPSWEAKRSSGSQEISRILWNQNVQYRIHKSLSPVYILSHIDPVHAHHANSQRSILILSSYLHLGLPSDLLFSGFPTKALYEPLVSPIHATCPAHLFFLDFITRIIFVEKYRAKSSSLCNLLHSPVTSFLLGPNIFLNTLSSKNLSLNFSLNVSDQVSQPYKTTGKIIVLYILFLTFLYIKLEDPAPNNNKHSLTSVCS